MHNNLKPSKNDIELKLNDLGHQLIASLNPEGFWEGRLSSSALGGAVAVAALWFDNPDKNAREIDSGLDWLKQTINADGSYGDTPDSPGNISTSLLVYALSICLPKRKSGLNPFRKELKNISGSIR